MQDRIVVIGSLNSEKECQDRVRVLSGGYLPSDTGNGLQRSAKGNCKIQTNENKGRGTMK